MEMAKKIDYENGQSWKFKGSVTLNELGYRKSCRSIYLIDLYPYHYSLYGFH